MCVNKMADGNYGSKQRYCLLTPKALRSGDAQGAAERLKPSPQRGMRLIDRDEISTFDALPILIRVTVLILIRGGPRPSTRCDSRVLMVEEVGPPARRCVRTEVWLAHVRVPG